MQKEKIYKLFDTTYHEFAKGIFRFVYFKVSEYELAQDITEETFIRYWKVLTKEKKIDNHKALLYFIARGLVVDYYRRKNHTKRVSIEKIDERLLEAKESIEDTVSQRQEVEYVFKKIRQLKKEYQDMLFLHYIEELTVKEIAFIQKKNENAIRVFLHRALKALKEIL